MDPKKYQRKAFIRQIESRLGVAWNKPQDDQSAKVREYRIQEKAKLYRQKMEFEAQAMRDREAQKAELARFEKMRQMAQELRLLEENKKRAKEQIQQAHHYLTGLEEAEALIESLNNKQVA